MIHWDINFFPWYNSYFAFPPKEAHMSIWRKITTPLRQNEKIKRLKKSSFLLIKVKWDALYVVYNSRNPNV